MQKNTLKKRKQNSNEIERFTTPGYGPTLPMWFWIPLLVFVCAFIIYLIYIFNN
jgi:hypothetical protein